MRDAIKMGRPPIGPQVMVRLPEPMLRALDARASVLGVKRAELIRRLLADGLEAE